MDRWSGIMKVSLNPYSRARYQIAASLRLSSSGSLAVPSQNAILFSGDRVQGTGNPVIEKLSNLQTIAETLVSKLGDCTNAWVIEASTFRGPFAVYKDFVPSVDRLGEPQSYDATGFPASKSVVLLLSICLKEVKILISEKLGKPYQDGVCAPCLHQPRIILLGFSKGGMVLNQLMTEIAFLDLNSTKSLEVNETHDTGDLVQIENQIIPSLNNLLLDSIAEIHFVDAGLNCAGAYLTDPDVIQRISKRLLHRAQSLKFVLHGTPRQWCDRMRVWIREEKDTLVQLLKSEAESGGNLSVSEKLYFADMTPNLQMHFEIIEILYLKNAQLDVCKAPDA
ncbi:uncharacterized protein LOC141693354 isoform X3 [Apium graveolens]